VVLNDHVTEVNADAKLDALLFRHLRLPIDHPALDLNSAAHGIYDTRKFRQKAVAR
jgi:hypothetical protein